VASSLDCQVNNILLLILLEFCLMKNLRVFTFKHVCLHAYMVTTMEEERKVKTVLWILLFCFLSAFVLMVTSICTSFWYTTHPLSPRVDSSFGSIGLIEHCSKSKNICMERSGILKFTDKFWPYRPLKNRDFDTTLLMLIISMISTVSALALTLVLCFDVCNRKRWLRWVLFIVSIISAVLGITSVLYLDTKVKSDKFRHGWSSHIAWLAVIFLIFVNFPAVYLISIQPVESNHKLHSEHTRKRTENEYILPPLYAKHAEYAEYADINNVE